MLTSTFLFPSCSFSGYPLSRIKLGTNLNLHNYASLFLYVQHSQLFTLQLVQLVLYSSLILVEIEPPSILDEIHDKLRAISTTNS